MDKAKLELLGLEYQALKNTIDDAEARQLEVKDEIRGVLPIFDPTVAPAEQKWQAGPTSFAWVKGRVSERVDTKKLRTKLALAGVSVSVLDQAFAESTTTTEGSPSLRISAADPNEEE